MCRKERKQKTNQKIRIKFGMMKSGSEDKFTAFFFILLLFCLFLTNNKVDSEEETILEDYIICRQCGSDIGLRNFIIHKLRPAELHANNETNFNTSILVHELQNPFGVSYRVITLKRASCAKIDVWTESYIWFPGYAWKLCFCPKCSAHIGWMYEPVETAKLNQVAPSDKGFYAIIINSVISEKYVNSLTGQLSKS